MCFPFHYCALCETLTSPFSEYILQDPNKRPLYFCSAECRLKHFERSNRTIPAPSPLQHDKRDYGYEDDDSAVAHAAAAGAAKKRRRSMLATGRYVDASYYSI